MTHRAGNVVTIENTRPAPCDCCGRRLELRPYGPNGESLCFDCGMLDESAAKRQFDRLLVDDGGA